MKNMIKMSLVAAVAVAGLSSTVAAKPLAEAIKDVDVSGSIVYRYEDYKDDKLPNTSQGANSYKIATSIKSKINDTLTSTVRVVTGTGIADNAATFAGLSSSSSSDLNPVLQVSQANFTAKVAGATVIAGKQGIATPWTKAIDSDGNEQTGTGVVALVPAGPVTVAAAVFNQTNLDTTGVGATGTEDVAALGAMAKVGPVALDVWYLNVSDLFDTYTIGAKATVEGISINARHTALDMDATTTDNSISYLKVSAKVGPASVWANYAMTDKEGGTAALQATAATNMIGWKVYTNAKADADMIQVGAGMDVMAGLNVTVNYNTIDYKVGTVETEETELYTQIMYKMEKNFYTYLRFGAYDKKSAGATIIDSPTRARIQVEYKF